MNQITLGKMIDEARILCNGEDEHSAFVRGQAELITGVCDIVPEHIDTIVQMILV